MTLRSVVHAGLAATMLLAACGDDSEDQPGSATYTGTMTGVVSSSLEGPAVFGVTLDNGANAGGFSLVLGDSSEVRIALFTYTAPKPRAGTYEIVAPNFPAGSDTVFTGTVSYHLQGPVAQLFEIRGGTITLSRANHNRTTGTFELRAERTTPADRAEVFISGSFDAGQIPQVF